MACVAEEVCPPIEVNTATVTRAFALAVLLLGHVDHLACALAAGVAFVGNFGGTGAFDEAPHAGLAAVAAIAGATGAAGAAISAFRYTLHEMNCGAVIENVLNNNINGYLS
jgi:hypothetical protein